MKTITKFTIDASHEAKVWDKFSTALISSVTFRGYLPATSGRSIQDRTYTMDDGTTNTVGCLCYCTHCGDSQGMAEAAQFSVSGTYSRKALIRLLGKSCKVRGVKVEESTLTGGWEAEGLDSDGYPLN